MISRACISFVDIIKINNFKRKFRQVRFFENENFETHIMKDTFYSFTINIQSLIEKYKFNVHVIENVKSNLLKKKAKNLISFSHQNLIYKMIQVMTEFDKKN